MATYTSTAFQLSVGSGQSITAVYGGDANFATSTSSTLMQTVNQDGTTASVTSVAEPLGLWPVGDFQGHGDGKRAGAGRPRAPSPSWTARSTWARYAQQREDDRHQQRAAGRADTIAVMYSGDGNYASTSAMLSQTVNSDATKTALASSANPSVDGQAVTFTATVTRRPREAALLLESSTSWTGRTPSGAARSHRERRRSSHAHHHALAVGSHSITAV